jgi:hypothetical protein
VINFGASADIRAGQRREINQSGGICMLGKMSKPMKKLFLLSALLLTPAHAATVNDTFTCVGTLTSKGLNPGFYQIVAAGDADYPMTCLLDDASQASSRQILAVCHEGDTCIVRASRQSGNANMHSIDKVLSVRRAPKR